MLKQITSGLYSVYKFNKTDLALRRAGFYCEELFPKKDAGLVLRRLAKDFGYLEKIAIIQARQVITSEIGKETYALYMPSERINPKEDNAQSSPKCTDEQISGSMLSNNPSYEASFVPNK